MVSQEWQLFMHLMGFFYSNYLYEQFPNAWFALSLDATQFIIVLIIQYHLVVVTSLLNLTLMCHF